MNFSYYLRHLSLLLRKDLQKRFRAYYKLEYVSACKALNPDIFIIGEDWGRSKHNIDVETYLKSKGKKIIKVKYNAQTSSTKIKQTVIGQLRGSEEDYQPTTEIA